jgi:hypothetical protein
MRIDNLSANVGESPEHIAFRLLELIMSVEGASRAAGSLDRKWILDTYGECLTRVRRPVSSTKVSPEAAERLARRLA